MNHLYTFVIIVNDFQKSYIYSELFGYIAAGRVNIRICRDITGLPPIASLRKLGMGAGVVWGGVDMQIKL